MNSVKVLIFRGFPAILRSAIAPRIPDRNIVAFSLGMDLNQALELADQLMVEQTGKHLNDLEREVFLGSWQGYTYDKIYPLNPEYVEKDVGYKLWKKLSQVLGERVTKKTFRGALERLSTRTVLIIHQNQAPDHDLALQLHAAMNRAGWRAYLSDEGNVPGLEWSRYLDARLHQCHYCLLILSPQAAASEMVLEQVRLLRERQSRSLGQSRLALIRLNYPADLPLPHDLTSYLEGGPQLEWQAAQTPQLLQSLLRLLQNPADWNALPRVHPTVPTVLPTALPQPTAEPELPSGQVRLASAFYVERVPYEARCYREVLQPSALIRIKAPRQMGKTSLMARILYQAREQGYRTVPLSFQHADATIFDDLNQLLRWFCSRISRKLKLPDRVDDYWSDTYGSKDNCSVYFEDYLLAEANTPLVLGLDEVDRVFQYPRIADDFLGLLRAWYEEGSYGDTESDRWQQLRLVVVHSTEVYIPLDVNQSPFNVGLPIELPEFSPEQVLDLTKRHDLCWSEEQVDPLMALVGGHPYLVRLALYAIAQGTFTLEELLQVAATESGPYSDHLRRHLWNLQQHPDLAAAYHQVVTANTPIELGSVPAFKLHSMGLVQFQGNQVRPSFDLYRQYFPSRLAML